MVSSNYFYLVLIICTVMWFGVVSLFNGILNLSGLFNAKAILVVEQ